MIQLKFIIILKQNKLLFLIEEHRVLSTGAIMLLMHLESIKILDAYTILPNGSHIKVPLKNIRSAKGDMDSEAASYSDTQYKVIIYPKVAVGSQLYLKYIHIRHAPLFRG